MILVPRPPGSAPEILEKDGEAGWRERKKALEYFLPGSSKAPSSRSVPRKRVSKGGKVRKAANADETPAKPTRPKFTVYNHELVKDALARLFNGKCAYCELKYESGQPGDIDHWRPKGRVAESRARVHPGYWWLAARWENLLPTCAECNRPRTGRDRDASRSVKRGKADQFPLADETRRAFTPDDDLVNEEPLLLDPTHDHPEKFLGFNQKAEAVALENNARGDATIRILGLNRIRLTLHRHEVLGRLLIVQSKIQKNVVRLDRKDVSEDLRDEFRSELREHLAELSKAIEPSAQFSAMARASIIPFLKSIAPQLDTVLRELTAPD